MTISLPLLEVLYFSNTFGQKDGTQVESHVLSFREDVSRQRFSIFPAFKK